MAKLPCISPLPEGVPAGTTRGYILPGNDDSLAVDASDPTKLVLAKWKCDKPAQLFQLGDVTAPIAEKPSGFVNCRLVGTNSGKQIYRVGKGHVDAKSAPWKQFDGLLVNVSTCGENIYGVNHFAQRFRRTETKPWVKCPAPCAKAVWADCSRDGSLWATEVNTGKLYSAKIGQCGSAKAVNAPEGTTAVLVRCKADNACLIVTECNRAFSSSDSGATWTPVMIPCAVKHIDWTENGDAMICVSADGNSCYYNAGGQGWTKLDQPSASPVLTLMISESHLVACDEQHSIFYRNFGNQPTWVQTPGKLRNCDITSEDGSSLPGAKPWDYSTGEGWKPEPAPAGAGFANITLVGTNKQNNVFRIGYGANDLNSLPWKQFDGALVNVSAAGENIFGINNAGTCFYRTEKTAWACNGGGAAWAAITRDGAHAWTTGTQWGGHPWYKSGLKGTRGGAGWKKWASPGGKLDVVRVRDDNCVMVTTEANEAHFSEDCCKTWKQVKTPGPVKHIDFTDNGDCLVCVTTAGVGYYNAGGQGWVELDGPKDFLTLMICGGHIVGCDSQHGIWYRNFTDMPTFTKTNGALWNCDITSNDGSSVPGAKPWDYSTGEGWTAPPGPGMANVRLVGTNRHNNIWRTAYGSTDLNKLDWKKFDGALVNVSTAGENIFGINNAGSCFYRTEKTAWACNGGGAAWAAITRDGAHAWTTGTQWGGHPWYKSGLKGTRGGAGWKKWASPGGKLDVVRVRDDNCVMVTTEANEAHFSEDCCKTWKQVKTPGPVKHIDFTDNGDCLVCVTTAGVGYFNAGGQGWVELDGPKDFLTLMICGGHIVGCDSKHGIWYRNFTDMTSFVKTNGELWNCDITSNDGSSVPGAKPWDYSIGADVAAPSTDIADPMDKYLGKTVCFMNALHRDNNFVLHHVNGECRIHSRSSLTKTKIQDTKFIVSKGHNGEGFSFELATKPGHFITHQAFKEISITSAGKSPESSFKIVEPLTFRRTGLTDAQFLVSFLSNSGGYLGLDTKTMYGATAKTEVLLLDADTAKVDCPKEKPLSPKTHTAEGCSFRIEEIPE